MGSKPYTFDVNKKHSLGQRAFILFLCQRITIVLIFVAISFGVWYAAPWLPADYAFWGVYISHLLFAITGAVFVLVFLRTYLEYRYYTYLFTDDAFIMTYGYMVRNEIATLYHQIQNVNIQRSILDRMIGVSQIIILMTGSDRDAHRNQIVLPAVGDRKARLVQSELLRRARRHAEQPQAQAGTDE
jgi:uncharacterized membrane protein YdbT with pleckstrin-like domain